MLSLYLHLNQFQSLRAHTVYAYECTLSAPSLFQYFKHNKKMMNLQFKQQIWIVDTVLKKFHVSIRFIKCFAKLKLTTVMVLIFWDFLMCYQILFSPQVKWSVIIRNEHGIYKLPHELLNVSRIRTLVKYHENLKTI